MKTPTLKQRGKAIHLKSKVKGVEISYSLGLQLNDKMKFENNRVHALNSDLKTTRDVAEINNKLARFELCFQETYIELNNSGSLTNFKFKTLLKEKYEGDFTTKTERSTKLYDLVIEYEKGLKDGTIVNKKKIPYADTATLKPMLSGLIRLKEFCNTRTIHDLGVNTDKEYFAFLKKKYPELALSSSRHQLKVLKLFGKWLFEERVLKINFGRDWERPAEPKTTHVYLTNKELDAISAAIIPANIAHYRILFMVQSYTGLRVSDLMTLRKHNISNNRIVVSQQKTEEPVIIPIHKKLKPWLKSWLEHPKLGKVYDQEYNEELKFIADQAKIRDSVQITTKTLSGVKTELVPKYKVVSSHTARRTAITNLYLNGCPKHIIMAISGHKTESSLRKYIKASGVEILDNTDIDQYF